MSANQKPGLGGSDQSEARKDREPDRCPEIQNTLIRGEREREESRLNLTAFNEPKPRHLLISAQLVLCGEREDQCIVMSVSTD